MIWAAVLMALAIGWTSGYAAASFVMRRVGEENEQLRGALRYFRGSITTQHHDLRHVSRYIDDVLSDEAGA